MYKKKNQKETKQKFKLLEAARRRAQESLRYVAPVLFSRFWCRQRRIGPEPYCNIEIVNA